jgi:hypothetical protein
MRLRPRTIEYRSGAKCCVTGCHALAEFDVYCYDLHLIVGDGVIEEWYVQDKECPFICWRHMKQNEREAVGERRPSGIVLYPYTNRAHMLGYTKYVPLPEMHPSLTEGFADHSITISAHVGRQIGIIESEQPQLTQRALEGLKPTDRQLLLALFVEDKTKEAVCEELGITRSYLRVMVHRAIARFRFLYNSEPRPGERTDEMAARRNQPEQEPADSDRQSFDLACASINDELLRVLCEKPELMRELRPRCFEELIADLFARRGFAVKLTPPTRDGGVDIYAVEHHALGESLYVIECKRYKAHRRVGVEPVRGLYAVTEAKRATRGILVTTSSFTDSAVAFASPLEYRLTLRDYEAVCEWIKTLKPGTT